MNTGQGELRMSDGEFRMFAELIRAHCGLHFGQETRFLLERRVERRMRELGVASFPAYHLELRGAPAGDGELGRLIDEVVTNETYFFRERRQLSALVGEILPEILLRRRSEGGVRRCRSGRPAARAAKSRTAS